MSSFGRGRERKMDYQPCQHFSNFKAKNRNPSFQFLQKCLQVGRSYNVCLKREENEVPECAFCGCVVGRLYACLSCAAVGCWNNRFEHVRNHAEAFQGHEIAVDVDRAELFCCICKDQIYDPEFDRSILYAMASARPITENTNPMKSKNKRRKVVPFQPWAPSPIEIQALTEFSRPISISSALPPGLRGLNNLGNTCFMNSVLQALLHTPPLRNFFLCDKHNRGICQRKSSRPCFGCNMDEIFSAVFSGSHAPYSPAQFLYTWWKHAENLSGYEQQDSHEFFISTLNGIHSNEGMTVKGKRNSEREEEANCRCIAHRVFAGILRSDVTCTICGSTSTTHDPCIDISLDLKNHNSDHSTSSAVKTESEVNPLTRLDSSDLSKNLSDSLTGCLDHFTRQERLGLNEKFFCEFCQTRQESFKQMSIRRLPLVLCFHIKRFEHSSSLKASKKIDRHMQFPVHLSMAPYLSSAAVKSRLGNRFFSFGTKGRAGSAIPEDLVRKDADYELFAVITHYGKLESGHYVCFLRLREEWFKCDDAWITKVDEETVRSCQAYMLFYVKNMFTYRSREFYSPP